MVNYRSFELPTLRVEFFYSKTTSVFTSGSENFLLDSKDFYFLSQTFRFLLLMQNENSSLSASDRLSGVCGRVATVSARSEHDANECPTAHPRDEGEARSEETSRCFFLSHEIFSVVEGHH